AEVVEAHPDVIVVDGTAGTRALKRATSTIPLVMANAADPVGSGLVPNLAHPGANVTGVSNMLAELSAKRLQLLKEAVPAASLVAVLWNRDTPYSAKVLQQLELVAPSLAIKLKVFGVRRLEEIIGAFHAISKAHVDAIYVVEDPLFTAHRSTLLRLALNSKSAYNLWWEILGRRRRIHILRCALWGSISTSSGIR